MWLWRWRLHRVRDSCLFVDQLEGTFSVAVTAWCLQASKHVNVRRISWATHGSRVLSNRRKPSRMVLLRQVGLINHMLKSHGVCCRGLVVSMVYLVMFNFWLFLSVFIFVLFIYFYIFILVVSLSFLISLFFCFIYFSKTK